MNGELLHVGQPAFEEYNRLLDHIDAGVRAAIPWRAVLGVHKGYQVERRYRPLWEGVLDNVM
jgi:hypothetical protein